MEYPHKWSSKTHKKKLSGWILFLHQDMAEYLVTKCNQMISLSLYGILKTSNYHLKWHTLAHDNPTEGLHSSGTPPTCLHSSGSILQPTLKYGDQTPPISSHCIFPNSGTIISVAMMTDITRAITARKNTDCFKDILYRRVVDKIILLILEHVVSSERRSKTLIVFFTTWKRTHQSLVVCYVYSFHFSKSQNRTW